MTFTRPIRSKSLPLHGGECLICRGMRAAHEALATDYEARLAMATDLANSVLANVGISVDLKLEACVFLASRRRSDGTDLPAIVSTSGAK